MPLFIQCFFPSLDYNMQNNNSNIGRKDEWENGQIDWLHQYQSDRIIDRLLTKF